MENELPPSYSFCMSQLPPEARTPPLQPQPPPDAGGSSTRITIPINNHELVYAHQTQAQNQNLRNQRQILPSICCCQPRTWARITGLHTTLFSLIYTLYIWTTSSERSREEGFDVLLLLALGLVGVFAGLVLFVGAHCGKRWLVFLWVLPAGIFIGNLLVQEYNLMILKNDLKQSSTHHEDTSLVLQYLVMVVPTALCVLSFAIVCVHCVHLFVLHKKKLMNQELLYQVQYF